MNAGRNRRLTEGLSHQLLRDRLSFYFRSVYSNPSKSDFVAHAKALGYQVIMVLIDLESSILNQARVAMRMIERVVITFQSRR